MSRTFRRKRPSMNLGEALGHRHKDGKVWDGTPQHVSPDCENNKGCPYCPSNRKSTTNRRLGASELEFTK